MKLLHVIPAVAPRYGGPSVAVTGMCRGLTEAGHEVLLATTDADGRGRIDVATGTPQDREGVSTLFFPRQWSEALKFSAPLARWLARNVTSYDTVHVHAVFSHASLAAAAACRKEQVPYVVRPLGTLDPWSMRQKRLRKWCSWQLAAKRAIRGAAAVHYTTIGERASSEAWMGTNHGVVIPLGIDERFFDSPGIGKTSTARPPAPHVLVLARLHPKKGVHLLLEAFLDAARDELGDWRLVIAGDGPANYVRSLKQRVALQNRERVTFAGWLSDREKLLSLQEAELLALPSRQENFALAVVEALACGTPVLVGEQVNLADEIRAAGAGWVVPRDRGALAAALRQILADADERRARGAAGRRFAERYRWPRVIPGLVRLYESIAGGGKPQALGDASMSEAT